MVKQGRGGVGGRKVLPSRNQSKRLSKANGGEGSRNIDKAMIVSTKGRGSQAKRPLRPKRVADREKMRRLAREPSPDAPRPDGRFVFSNPTGAQAKLKAKREAAQMKD